VLDRGVIRRYSARMPADRPGIDHDRASHPAEPPGSPRHRVLLVDDHAVIREGLALALEGQPGIQLVGQAADGVEAVEAARALAPDVILIDMRMPRMAGVEATRRIKAEKPEVRVIGLSMYGEEEDSRAMLAAGAEKLLSKSDPIEAICRAICGSG
jgi:DNA-binding NarL/FixJ family response regulator